MISNKSNNNKYMNGVHCNKSTEKKEINNSIPQPITPTTASINSSYSHRHHNNNTKKTLPSMKRLKRRSTTNKQTN